MKNRYRARISLSCNGLVNDNVNGRDPESDPLAKGDVVSADTPAGKFW